MSNSVFAKYTPKAYPYRYRGTITTLTPLAGGIPSDPRVVKGYVESKIEQKDALIQEAVMDTVRTIMEERGLPADGTLDPALLKELVGEAVTAVADLRTLNGFKRDGQGLYIEGRQLKACLKEAASIAANEGKITTKRWGNPDNDNYRKGIKGWFPEHVFVMEDRLHLGVTEPDGVMQRFVHVDGRPSAISYEEYVENASFEFTVETDHEFTDEQWAAIWLTAERQGVGASRSQGFGRYEVVRWERVS